MLDVHLMEVPEMESGKSIMRMDGMMGYLLILGLVVLVPGGRTHTRLCTTLYR